mmetsp:Transcript_127837/g.220959  ORF Transcript_127837/g.220959 Transcript_127837/m.220959 type:complete len:87 (+) Transcript_127837:276-536(+)
MDPIVQLKGAGIVRWAIDIPKAKLGGCPCIRQEIQGQHTDPRDRTGASRSGPHAECQAALRSGTEDPKEGGEEVAGVDRAIHTDQS